MDRIAGDRRAAFCARRGIAQHSRPRTQPPQGAGHSAVECRPGITIRWRIKQPAHCLITDLGDPTEPTLPNSGGLTLHEAEPGREVPAESTMTTSGVYRPRLPGDYANRISTTPATAPSVISQTCNHRRSEARADDSAAHESL